MSRRGAGKPPTERVSHKKSIEAAFERQRKRRRCTICGQEVLVCLYATHINSCTLADDDSDVEVITQLTGDESRALKAGPAIVLDDDQNVKVESEGDEHQIDIPVGEEQSGNDENSLGMPAEKESLRGDQEDRNQAEIAAPVAVIHRALPATPSQAAARPLNRRPPKSQVAISKSDVPKAPARATGVAQIKKEDPDRDPVLPTIPNVEENDEHINGPGIPYSKYMKKFIKTLVTHGFDKVFWRDDWKMVDGLSRLSHGALELLMRMFLRRSQWFKESSLAKSYVHLKDSMADILKELATAGLIQDGDGLMTQEELFAICDLATMKNIAKLYHLDIGQNKQQLCDALSKILKTQKDIFGRSKGVAAKMYKTFYQEVGRTVKLADIARMLLEAILTLTCPTETNSAHIYDLQANTIYHTFLVTVHDIESGTLRVAAPSVDGCQFITIFRNSEELKEYVRAKELEVKAFLGTRTATVDEIGDFVTEAKQKLAECDLRYYSSLPPSIRRFSPPHVFARVIAVSATCYEKAKKYPMAIELHKYLLFTEELVPFGGDLRGSWWERLALNLEAHMKEQEEAKEMLTKAFTDSSVADKDMLALEDRYARLFKDQAPCRVLNGLSPAKAVTIYGMVLDKELGDGRVNRFVEKSEEGNLTAVSVENVARTHYMDNGGYSHGVHAEGGIWHTVMGLVFFKQMYNSNSPYAYMSSYQRVPTDLNFPAFYTSRKELLDERMEWFRESASDADLLVEITENWRKAHGIETSKIVWDLFDSPEALYGFIKAAGRKPLAEVFSYLMMDHRNTRSGFPDLTLWDPVSKKCMAVEVKGPGDRLSTKQRIWLHRLSKAGIPAEVCHVKAKAARTLTSAR